LCEYRQDYKLVDLLSPGGLTKEKPHEPQGRRMNPGEHSFPDAGHPADETSNLDEQRIPNGENNRFHH
jgi:hypothetical protein